MSRTWIGVAATAVALAVVGLAAASHDADVHSPNMALKANFNDGGTYASGTDIAFWGRYAIAGNQNPGGFRVIDISDPANPTEVGQFACNGSQSDVSVWGGLVFVSIDGPRASPACDAPSGSAWEGIRIVSIADPANPVQVATVYTDCGSHTHTLVPDQLNKRVYLYVESYPLGAPTANCSPQTHHKISVVEVPLRFPERARVVSTPDVSPAIGCHDVTVLLEKKLAGAACISESQVWDISNPTVPRILAHIENPGINIHHSTTFSFDGKTLAIGDELGGAAVAPGCVDGDEHLPLGAIWFYDVSTPSLPVPKGTFSIPQRQTATVCTAHNFNTIPLTDGRDVLVSAWYSGGTTVVDFTDPANPAQLGYYIPKTPVAGNSWSSYWYRGRIFANNLGTRGFDVLAYKGDGLEQALKLRRLNPSTMEPLP